MALSKNINMEVGRELRAALLYYAFLNDRDLSKEGRRMIRKILKEGGHYTGEIDQTGQIDPEFLEKAMAYLEQKENEREAKKRKLELNHA